MFGAGGRGLRKPARSHLTPALDVGGRPADCGTLAEGSEQAGRRKDGSQLGLQGALGDQRHPGERAGVSRPRSLSRWARLQGGPPLLPCAWCSPPSRNPSPAAPDQPLPGLRGGPRGEGRTRAARRRAVCLRAVLPALRGGRARPPPSRGLWPKIRRPCKRSPGHRCTHTHAFYSAFSRGARRGPRRGARLPLRHGLTVDGARGRAGLAERPSAHLPPAGLTTCSREEAGTAEVRAASPPPPRTPSPPA